MKHGFTLIELIIVIGLIGLLMSLGLPRIFTVRTPVVNQFIARLNAFVQQGAQVAVQTDTVQTIRFNFGSARVEREGTKLFVEIPADVEIKDIIINGESQITGQTTEVHFYITPEGLTQRVQLVVADRAQKARAPQQQDAKFVLNPFTAQFARV